MPFRANIMVAARAEAEIEPPNMRLRFLLGVQFNRRRPGARNSWKEKWT
jgi:hypothetical protein